MTVLAERRGNGPGGPGDALPAAGQRPAATGLFRAVGLPLLIAAACFAVLAPAATWAEFQNSIECIAVGTALETRRDGHWLAPTLGGETRTRKPPLTTWLTAAAVRPGTVAGMSGRDAAGREAALAWFTWEARWPSIAATCLMLLAVYDLGRTLGGWRVGAFAALAGASNLLVLKYGRMTTPDTQLALWVAVTNALLTRAVLRRQYWLGLAGGGAALGLAFMAKGPVALLMTVAPVVLFLCSRSRFDKRPDTRFDPHWRNMRPDEPRPTAKSLQRPDESADGLVGAVTSRAARSPLVPLLVGLVVLLAIAVPWYATLAIRVPRVWSVWFNEVSRARPADPRPDPWWDAFRFFWMFCPWTPWLVLGLVGGAVAWGRRQSPGLVLTAALLVVPLLVLAFFPERKDRYRQPLVAPAAVLVAWSIDEYLKRRRAAEDDATGPADRRRGRLLEGLHWATVAAITVGLPAAAHKFIQTDDGLPWLRWQGRAAWAAAGAVVVVVGVRLARRRPAALVVVTFLAVVAYDAVYQYGLLAVGRTTSDMKPMADYLWRNYPDARVYATGRGRTQAPVDLNIYLNRPVPPRDHVADLRPADVPQVVVVFQSKGQAEPTSPIKESETAPPGVEWVKVASFRRGNNWCHAFVLSARQRS